MKKIIVFSLLVCSSAMVWTMQYMMEISAATTLKKLPQYAAKEEAARNEVRAQQHAQQNELRKKRKKRKTALQLPIKKQTRKKK